MDVPGLPNGLGVALAANFTVPRRPAVEDQGLGDWLGDLPRKNMDERYVDIV